MQVEDQSETIEFLRAELARMDDTDEVRTVETHISVILIARRIAWKLKKAVRLPYLDFSTAEGRLATCERELVLNRRTAPDLYLGVRGLARGEDGALRLDGEGELIDAVLEMARFDDDRLLDNIARRGEMSPQLVAKLAANVAAFHAGAEPRGDGDATGSERVEAVLRINEAGLGEARSLFGDGPVDELIQSTRELWERHRPLMDERQRQGRVRLCHGDLHLRNIVEIDGEPVLFDCLEFDEEMATTDTLYDLAFLLMDFWHRDLRALANLLLNRYLDAADAVPGLPLLPLFLSMRATVRAHVLATQAMEAGEGRGATVEKEAREYLDLARDMLKPRPAMLVAVGGFSGSGKSTAAAAIAHGVGPVPGARIVSTDRIRKRLFGVAPETRLPPEAYRPEVSARVYEEQRGEAERVLATGHGAIVDAVFDRQNEREAVEAMAASLGVAFRGLWLEAPEGMLVERIGKRRGDPSDATAEVVRNQLGRDPGTIGWRRIDTTGADLTQRLGEALSD